MKDTKKIVYDRMRNKATLIDVIGNSTADPNIFPFGDQHIDEDNRISPNLVTKLKAFIIYKVDDAGSPGTIIQPGFIKPDEYFTITSFGKKASFADTAIEIVDDLLDGVRIVGLEWGIKYMYRVGSIIDGGPYVCSIAQRTATFLAKGIYKV